MTGEKIDRSTVAAATSRDYNNNGRQFGEMVAAQNLRRIQTVLR